MLLANVQRNEASYRANHALLIVSYDIANLFEMLKFD